MLPRRSPASRLAEHKVVAILHGRDEWGPRALGARSILADPRTPEMKGHLNAKIKFREEYPALRPGGQERGLWRLVRDARHGRKPLHALDPAAGADRGGDAYRRHQPGADHLGRAERLSVRHHRRL